MHQGNYVHESSTKCLVAVGSNLKSNAGGEEATVGFALELLAASDGIDLTAQSRLYRTPAYPAGSGPDFVNAAVEVVTGLPPERLLARLHAIEAEIGRQRRQRWGARMIDLDLLCCGQAILPDRATLDRWMRLSPGEQAVKEPERLILPHPRIQDRAFVLVPLMDIAPAWRHPATGLTVSEMLAALPGSEVDAIIELERSG